MLERLLPRYWRQAAGREVARAAAPPEVEEVDPAAPASRSPSPPMVEVRPEIELRNYKDFACRSRGRSRRRRRSSAPSTTCAAATPSGCRSSAPAARGDRRARCEITEPAPGPRPGSRADGVRARDRRAAVWEELRSRSAGLAAGPEPEFSRRSRASRARAPRGRARYGPDGKRFRSRSDALRRRARRGQGGEAAAARRRVRQAPRPASRASRAPRRRRAPDLRPQGGRSAPPARDRDARPARRAPPDAASRGRRAARDRGAAARLRRGPRPARRGPGEGRGSTGRSMGEQAKPHAERRVKARLLLDAVARERGDPGRRGGVRAGARACSPATQDVAARALRQRLDENGRAGRPAGADAARKDGTPPARRADRRPGAGGRAVASAAQITSLTITEHEHPRHDHCVGFEPGSTGERDADSDGGRTDEPGRARLRHLFAPAQGQHHLSRPADRRRRREPDHRPDAVPRGGEPGARHPPLHQLAGRLGHGRPGDLRHHAVHQARRRDLLRRPGGVDGGGAARGRQARASGRCCRTAGS